MDDVYGTITKRNIVYGDFDRDVYAEEMFNNDEYMREIILTDRYTLKEVRSFILNKAPYIVIDVYNDGEPNNRCTLAEHLYFNQFNIEITDELMNIGDTGIYEVDEGMSGVWTYILVEVL